MQIESLAFQIRRIEHRPNHALHTEPRTVRFMNQCHSPRPGERQRFPSQTPMTSLSPNANSSWLDVATVVQRANKEFGCVVVDHPRAMKYLADQLISATPNIDQQTADEHLRPLADSVEMICTDDRRSDERFLKCIVMPERPIEIVYHFDGHKQSAADLLNRLAHVLDYTIVE